MTRDSGESPLRALMAEAVGEEYRSFASLSQAQRDPNGVVILEGDDGGQIYVVVRASNVACSEDTLRRLLSDLDVREWPHNNEDMRRICFERKRVGEGIAGGMGGARVCDTAWIHPRLEPLRGLICQVLEGQRDRLAS